MTSQPEYQAAAAEAVGQVQAADQSVDAGPTIEEMADTLARQKMQAAMSDYEQQLRDIMADAAKQRDAFGQQLAMMQRQLATVRAQAGPPVGQLLADSLVTRLDSLAATHPDLGKAHFAGVASQAASLADEVKAVASGSGSVARVEQLASGVIQFFERVHPRISSKFIEGSHAAVDEAERIIEEAAKLAPAAVSIVSAL